MQFSLLLTAIKSESEIREETDDEVVAVRINDRVI